MRPLSRFGRLVIVAVRVIWNQSRERLTFMQFLGLSKSMSTRLAKPR